MISPKVFLSHASEDKEPFVNEFALKLRQNGVDVWLDKWEMLPGDSLVDKIFEEGLKEAEAVIIILSKNSVSKPWVKEELNTSIVSRLQKATRLIPIVIDECEIPESLKSTLWETIKDLSNYNDNFNRILASIFGESMKPKLGAVPAYVSSSLNNIEGIEPIDNLVLKLSCESTTELPNDPIEPEEVFPESTSGLPPKAQIIESIEILENHGYLNVSHTIGGGSEHWGWHYTVTLSGFEKYCKAYITDYGQIVDKCAGLIVNNEASSNYELRDSLNIPLTVASHIINLLEHNGFVKVSGEIGVRISIYEVSAKLRRAMR